MTLKLDNNKYGFVGRLSREFPSQVMLDITEVCNLACIHCAHPKFKGSEYYAKAMLDPELNKKMVKEVSKYGKNITKYIRYTSNGEPLVHPKSYEMINYAVDHSDTKVTLTTNGTLLNEKKMLRLLNSGLHMIDISIDAVKEETYSKIRVNGDLNKTRSNVLKLINLINKSTYKTKLVVSFVEQHQNLSEADEFKHYWLSQGVKDVVIRRLHTNSGSNMNVNAIEKNRKIERRPCLYPWERVVLTAKGRLNYCPTDWFSKAEICDYNSTTIKDVWHSVFYKQLREKHLCNSFGKNDFCKYCPDWSNTSWPHDEKKSYADLVEKILYKEKDKQNILL